MYKKTEKRSLNYFGMLSLCVFGFALAPVHAGAQTPPVQDVPAARAMSTVPSNEVYMNPAGRVLLNLTKGGYLFKGKYDYKIGQDREKEEYGPFYETKFFSDIAGTTVKINISRQFGKENPPKIMMSVTIRDVSSGNAVYTETSPDSVAMNLIFTEDGHIPDAYSPTGRLLRATYKALAAGNQYQLYVSFIDIKTGQTYVTNDFEVILKGDGLNYFENPENAVDPTMYDLDAWKASRGQP